MENFVVIDLGSNSIRLRITQITEGNFLRVTHQLKEYVRLSENMGPERILQKVPMDRTLEALKKFKGIIDGLPNTHVVAIGTAATRQAKNQKEFLKRVKNETGLSLEVISGEREAYLDYLGAAHTLPLHNCLLMDTGGASTELILVQDGKPVNLTSLPFGSVTISQRFHLEDRITAASLFQAMTVVEKALSNLDWLLSAHKIPLVCLGGSNRTLAKIARNRWHTDAGDVPDIHGFTLPADDATDIMTELISRDRAGREDISGLTSDRSDVIVGGLTPLVLILRICHIGEIVFSNHGLREGCLFEYLAKRQAEHKAAPPAFHIPAPPEATIVTIDDIASGRIAPPPGTNASEIAPSKHSKKKAKKNKKKSGGGKKK